MATFGELQTTVTTLVIDPSPNVLALTPAFINSAIRKLQQKHNFKVMEASTTVTTTESQRILGARPADWKESRGKPYYLGDLDGFGEMDYVSQIGQAYAMYGDDPDLDFGVPRVLFEDDTNSQFLVFPYPDGLSSGPNGEYSVSIPYWRYLPALVNPGDTNWFTENATSWIEYYAASEAFYANQDDRRADTWRSRADREFSDILLTDKRRRLADIGSTIVPHLGARMPHIGR